MEWQPLPGGWSGQSFLAGVGEERSVVRIHVPSVPGATRTPEVEAALLRWVRGLVPVPEVLEVRPAAAGAPALLVTRYVTGVRGDDVVRGAGPEVLAAVGERLGRVAGRLAGIATLAAGEFVDERLAVEPSADADDVSELVGRHVDHLRGLDESGREALLDLVGEAQEVLDEVGRTCLVHGDLNPKNVVLDPVTHELRAVVDWEHGHSGWPHADLGSLLRFDRHPAWEEAVLAGWCRERDEDPALARHRARCADLASLVELAARPGGNLVVDLAEVFLAEVLRTGDLHAHP